MKKIILAVFLFTTYAASGQTIVDRSSSPSIIARDQRAYFKLTLRAPVFADTTAANTAIGRDSLGLLIVVPSIHKVYFRDTTAGDHKWTEFALNTPGTVNWADLGGSPSDNSDLMSLFNGKQDALTVGSASQYFRGDLSLATFPTDNAAFTNGAGYLTVVLDSNSITGDGVTTKLQLSGDASAPGASKYYGTNGGGTKGFYSLPAAGMGTVTSIVATAPLTGGTITSTGSIGLDTSDHHGMTYYDTRYAPISVAAFDTADIPGIHTENYFNTKYKPLDYIPVVTSTYQVYGGADGIMRETPNHTWDSTNHISTVKTPTASLTTVYPSFVASNSKAAITGNGAYGGAFESRGNGFGSSSKEASIRWYTKTGGTTLPTARLTFEQQLDNGSWTPLLDFGGASTAATMNFTGGITANTFAATAITNKTTSFNFQMPDGSYGDTLADRKWVRDNFGSGSGFTNPMDAAGQLIYGGSSGTPTKTATPGHAGMRPVWDGSVVKWSDTTAGGGALTGSTGDIPSFSGTNTQSNVAAVAAGSVFSSNGVSTKPIWTTAPLIGKVLLAHVPFVAPDTVYLFADSYGQGTGSIASGFGFRNTADAPDTNFATRLSTIWGIPFTNEALSGSGIWNAVSKANSTLAINTPHAFVVNISFNDLRRCGFSNDGGYRKIIGGYNALLSAFFLKSAIAAGSSNAALTYGGTWTKTYAASTVGGRSVGNGAYTNTPLDSIIYVMPSADSTLVIGMIGVDGTTYVGASYSIYDSTTLIQQGTENLRTDGISDGVYDNKRVPYTIVLKLKYGIHRIKIINTSANSTPFLIVDYFGHLRDASTATPALVYDIPYNDVTGYATAPASGSVAATLKAQAKIDSLLAATWGDYPIYQAHTNKYYDTLSGVSTVDHIHPNNTGDRQYTAAGIAVLPSLTATGLTGTIVQGPLNPYVTVDGVTRQLAFLDQVVRKSDRNLFYQNTPLQQDGSINLGGSGTFGTYVSVPGLAKMGGAGMLQTDAPVTFGTINGNPTMSFNRTGAPSNQKISDMYMNDTSWIFRFAADNLGSANTWMQASRTGLTSNIINLNATTIKLNGKVGINQSPWSTYGLSITAPSGGLGLRLANNTNYNLGFYYFSSTNNIASVNDANTDGAPLVLTASNFLFNKYTSSTVTNLFAIADTMISYARISYPRNLGGSFTLYSLVDKNYVDSARTAGFAAAFPSADYTLTADRTLNGSTGTYGLNLGASGNRLNFASIYSAGAIGLHGLLTLDPFPTITDANYVAPANISTYKLPAITADRTFTPPTGGGNALLFIYDSNTAGFAWKPAGTNFKDVTGTTITAFTNSTFYIFMNDGTNWIQVK